MLRFFFGIEIMSCHAKSQLANQWMFLFQTITSLEGAFSTYNGIREKYQGQVFKKLLNEIAQRRKWLFKAVEEIKGLTSSFAYGFEKVSWIPVTSYGYHHEYTM